MRYTWRSYRVLVPVLALPKPTSRPPPVVVLNQASIEKVVGLACRSPVVTWWVQPLKLTAVSVSHRRAPATPSVGALR